MSNPDSEAGWKNFPWIEIALVLVLAVMIATSINALLGQNIRNGITGICDEFDLWCAPTPTPTATPTMTPTPLTTGTPGLSSTSTP